MDIVSLSSFPRKVEGVQVTAENMGEISVWCSGKITKKSGKDGEIETFIKVQTRRPLNKKQTEAYIGDWVLQWEGGFKIYTDQALAKNFQRNVFDIEDRLAQSDWTVALESDARQKAESQLKGHTLSKDCVCEPAVEIIPGRNVFDQTPVEEVVCTCGWDQACSADNCTGYPKSATEAVDILDEIDEILAEGGN